MCTASRRRWAMSSVRWLIRAALAMRIAMRSARVIGRLGRGISASGPANAANDSRPDSEKAATPLAWILWLAASFWTPKVPRCTPISSASRRANGSS